jgi:AcrR family transcriptional regulator
MQSNDHDNRQTQDRILEVTVELIEEKGADAIRVAEVAERAHIGAPTIYYHYPNRERLIGDAQAKRLQKILSSTYPSLDEMINAIRSGDQDGSQELGTYLNKQMWNNENLDLSWAIIEVLQTARHDLHLRKQVSEIIAEDLRKRAEIVKLMQEAGWADHTVDPIAWAAFYMGANVGRVLTDLAPEVHPDDRTQLNMIERVNPLGLNRFSRFSD